jgi:prepilin-type N-terminal cleavage/methylation domain-containing protein
MRSSPTDGERGFTLLELVVCVGVFAAIALGALALLPALARNAQAGLVRDAALETARNALERARAAAAYYPPALVGDAAARAVATADHRWALAAQAGFRSAARLRAAPCGATASDPDVPLAVATSYDAPSDRLTVTVTYPHDPCANDGRTETVTLSSVLAPAQYAPQTQLTTPIGDPAAQ